MIDLLLIILFVNLITSGIAAKKTKHKQLILTPPFKICQLFGSFVWADHMIFGPFWILISLAAFALHDFLLFMLIFTIFWLIRSLGETLYWFLQQFHPRTGNEPGKFWINKYTPGEAVWFVHQIFWQCIAVLSLIATIYLSFLWLK